MYKVHTRTRTLHCARTLHQVHLSAHALRLTYRYSLYTHAAVDPRATRRTQGHGTRQSRPHESNLPCLDLPRDLEAQFAAHLDGVE